MALERRLHLHVPLRRDVVRADEDVLQLLRQLVHVGERALFDELLNELLRVETLLLRDLLEHVVDLVHDRRTTLRVLHDLTHEGEAEHRLDTAGAVRDDRNRAGRCDRRGVGVAQLAPLFLPVGTFPSREHAALFREHFRSEVRFVVQDLHDLFAECAAFVGVVADAELEQRIRETHHAKADATRRLRHVVDLRQRVLVDLDDVVEETRGAVDDLFEAIPVERCVLALALDQDAQVNGAQVAGVIRVKRLFAARVRRFDEADVLDRVPLVDAVDEDDAGLATLVSVLEDHFPDLADGDELAGSLALGVAALELLPLFVVGVLNFVDRVRIRLELIEETVGDRNRDVVVRETSAVVLERDEGQDVRVVDAEHAHVGSAAERTLLDRVGRFREDLNEGHRAFGRAAGRLHQVALRTEARERESCATTGFLDHRGRFDRVEDAFDRVLNGEHEARGEHAHFATRVHEGRAVRHELTTRHQLEELARNRDGLRGASARELQLGLRDVGRDAPEELSGGF